jgi:glycosyltransferase involved in cell wall biosynthesis
MKVAVFLHGLDNGSFYRLAVTLMPIFQFLGIDVEAVVASGDPEQLQHFGFPVVSVGSGPFSAFGLAAYLRRSRPDILMSMPMSKNFIALLARELSFTNTKVVVTEHTTMSDELYREHAANKKMRLLYPQLVRLLYPRRDGLIYPTNAVVEDRLFSKLIKLDAKPHQRIHNPLPTREEAAASMLAPHRWLTCDRERPVVLGVGRLMEQKGFDVLIRSIAELRDQQKPARLIILGEGDKLPDLQALVRELDLADYVDMPGYVENVMEYMRESDVFALSSRWETFGLVLVEAMVAGVPIVSTRIPGGPEEVLEDGRTAVLVQNEDPKALADGLSRVIEDHRLARHLVEQSAGEAEKYQPESVAAQYVAFFEQVLGRRVNAGSPTRLRPELSATPRA